MMKAISAEFDPFQTHALIPIYSCRLSASLIDIKNPEDIAASLSDVLKYIWREGEFPNGPFKTGLI